MVADTKPSDLRSETSISGFTARESSSDPYIIDGLLDTRVRVVPWPDNKYLILQKGTNRAITYTHHGPRLLEVDSKETSASHWLCVAQNGYFGFYNTNSGKYLGHDGANGMSTHAERLGGWELITPRQHPEGGYQLLQPYWTDYLKIIIASGGDKMGRSDHGDTLWEFIRV